MHPRTHTRTLGYKSCLGKLQLPQASPAWTLCLSEGFFEAEEDSKGSTYGFWCPRAWETEVSTAVTSTLVKGEAQRGSASFRAMG